MRDRGWSGDGWSGDRMPRNRIMLIILPLIVTMAVGLIVGIRLVSEKNATLRLSNTGQGAANSTPASPAPPVRPATSSATPSPTTPATATPAPVATAAATNMSCVRPAPRHPAPSGRPLAAAGCTGSDPSRIAFQLAAGVATAASGGGAKPAVSPAVKTAGAVSSAAAGALRHGPSRTAAGLGG